jgi:hypothetical protein
MNNFKLDEIPIRDLSDKIPILGINGRTFKQILKYTGYGSRTLYIILPIVIAILIDLIQMNADKVKVVGFLEIVTSIVLGIYLLYIIIVLYAEQLNGFSLKTPLFLLTILSILYFSIQLVQMVTTIVIDYKYKDVSLTSKILRIAKILLLTITALFAILATYNAPRVSFTLILLILFSFTALALSILSEIKMF